MEKWKENRNNYINEYRKKTYKTYLLKLRKDSELRKYLDSKENKNGFLTDLIRSEMMGGVRKMLLKDLEPVVNKDYSFTIEDLSRTDGTRADDYAFFEDIEESRKEKEVVSLYFWNNPRHNNEKAYYIVIK